MPGQRRPGSNAWSGAAAGDHHAPDRPRAGAARHRRRRGRGPEPDGHERLAGLRDEVELLMKEGQEALARQDEDVAEARFRRGVDPGAGQLRVQPIWGVPRSGATFAWRRERPEHLLQAGNQSRAASRSRSLASRNEVVASIIKTWWSPCLKRASGTVAPPGGEGAGVRRAIAARTGTHRRAIAHTPVLSRLTRRRRCGNSHHDRARRRRCCPTTRTGDPSGEAARRGTDPERAVRDGREVARERRRTGPELSDLDADKPDVTKRLADEGLTWRRSSVTKLILTAALSWSCRPGGPAEPQGPANISRSRRRPRVLDLGCYGGEIRPPRPSTRWRATACGSPVLQLHPLLPDRASLPRPVPHRDRVGDMTGRRGVPANRGIPQPNTVTIAEVLRAAGTTRRWSQVDLGGPKRPTPTDRGSTSSTACSAGSTRGFPGGPVLHPPPGRPGEAGVPEGRLLHTDAFGDYPSTSSPSRASRTKPFFQTSRQRPALPAPRQAGRHPEVRRHLHRRLGQGEGGRHAPAGRTRAVPKGNAAEPASRHHPPRLPPHRRQPGVGHRSRRPPGRPRPPDGRVRRDGRVHGPHRRPRRRRPEAHGEFETTLVLVPERQRGVRRVGPVRVRRRQRAEERLHTGDGSPRWAGRGRYHSYGSGWANAGNNPVPAVQARLSRGRHPHPLIAHCPRVSREGRVSATRSALSST